jgi:signal transduction histidine kinase
MHSRKKLRKNFQNQLISAMSHEFMTPLNSILQLSEFARIQLQIA